MKSPDTWTLRQPFGPRTIAILIGVAILLALSARHTQVDRMLVLSGEAVAKILHLREKSEVVRGVDRFAQQALPLVIAEETPVGRIENFDPQKLPWLSHLETRTKHNMRYDQTAGKMVEEPETETVLVQPVGYLVYVLGKMLESLEMALWGTLLAVVMGGPLAYFAARGTSPHRFFYVTARAIAGFLRALPELVSALVLVLAYGFGPMAGVLALGLHSTGFLGKFFADDIENADRGPQDALAGLGANRVKVLRYAVLPQVMPQYVAYLQYILERNVRMATVIGVVGAGGIGIELKGRFDMFDFGHVTTILIAIFATVMLLERLAQWVRTKLI